MQGCTLRYFSKGGYVWFSSGHKDPARFGLAVSKCYQGSGAVLISQTTVAKTLALI